MPQKYSPLNNIKLAERRRNIVLNSMYKLNMINAQDYDVLKNRALKLANNFQDLIAPHLKESVRIFLEDLVGKNKLYTGGLKVQTTIDANMQKIAQEVFKTHCSILTKKLNKTINGALIAIDVKTGEIKALVGGIDFENSQFNRAISAKRQMGSDF